MINFCSAWKDVFIAQRRQTYLFGFDFVHLRTISFQKHLFNQSKLCCLHNTHIDPSNQIKINPVRTTTNLYI